MKNLPTEPNQITEDLRGHITLIDSNEESVKEIEAITKVLQFREESKNAYQMPVGTRKRVKVAELLLDTAKVNSSQAISYLPTERLASARRVCCTTRPKTSDHKGRK